MPTEIELLKAQLAAISERIAALESRDAGAAEAVTPDEPLAPDVVLAISAAVAAYLGERAHIRSIRLVGTSRWAHQGRLNIQASHRLH
jgi:methylmalonyl-CoA carboxyltransferase large subunit